MSNMCMNNPAFGDRQDENSYCCCCLRLVDGCRLRAAALAVMDGPAGLTCGSLIEALLAGEPVLDLGDNRTLKQYVQHVHEQSIRRPPG
jgi:hypothetical protein